MIDGADRLSEEEARRVWKRAAELQSRAADPQPRPPVASTRSAQQAGYSLSQVREAAAEVGIADEFVALALAEGHDADVGAGDRVDRWAERLSGRGPRSLIVSRRFDRPIAAVYAAVERVFPRHHLALIGSHGQPLEGGLMEFAVSSTDTGAAEFVVTALFAQAQLETVQLRLLVLDQGSCLATLSAPLRAARRANLGKGAALSAGGGVVGGWAAGALGAALVLPLGIASAAAAAAIGGALLVGLGAGGSLGVAASRALRRSSERRATAALERLLQAVRIELRARTASEPASLTNSSLERGLPDGARSTH